MRDEGREDEGRQEILRMLDELDEDRELPQKLREVVAEILIFVYAVEGGEEEGENAVDVREG